MFAIISNVNNNIYSLALIALNVCFARCVKQFRATYARKPARFINAFSAEYYLLFHVSASSRRVPTSCAVKRSLHSRSLRSLVLCTFRYPQQVWMRHRETPRDTSLPLCRLVNLSAEFRAAVTVSEIQRRLRRTPGFLVASLDKR